jgi:carboxylesterase type B
VYLYHFEEGAAFHAFELPYVFGIPNALLGAPTLVEPLRAYVQTTFTNFARDGVPVSTPASGLPEWPRYLTDSDRHIVLKRDVIASANLSKADCDFLEQIGAVQ